MVSIPPRRRPRLALFGLISLFLISPSASAAPMTLPEALESLRRDGIDTLYTDRLVTRDHLVDQLPPDGPAEERLRALLSPMGLSARPMKDGRWAVVAAPTATLEGCLISDPGQRPVVDATVTVVGSPSSVRSDVSGCFRLLRVTAGSRALDVTRPGYIGRRAEVEVRPGAGHRVDLKLRLDAQAGDEIFVAATPEEPPIGTWRMSRALRESANRADGDLMEVVADTPGALREAGVSFGVRGSEAARLTLVVDGLSIVEPYHFRDLGYLAGAVTPEAVDDVQLHRGSPPLVYGNRSGGVLEMTTKSPIGRFSGRLGVASETSQAAVDGSVLEGRARWMAAYREGRPELPKEVSEISSMPFYWDAVGKASLAATGRQELKLQVFLAHDNLDFQSTEELFREQSLVIGQDSRHVGFRYLASFGSRHLIDALISDVDVDRLRTSIETDSTILIPDPFFRGYVVEDRRATQSRSLRIHASSGLADDFDLEWGGEGGREQTAYDYRGSSEFRSPSELNFNDTLEDRPVALFSQGTWRPRADLSLKAGLRWDSGTEVVPRLSFSLHRHRAIWSAGWSRVVSAASTDELPLADSETMLPRTETTDYLSLGYRRVGAFGSLDIEAFQQQISEPRVRTANFYIPVSRIPELEQDRYFLTSEEGRTRGLEIRFRHGTERRQGEVTYVLSRSEDFFSGRWYPRREDRRHSLNLAFSIQVRDRHRFDFRWSGATGRPTTPIDLDRVGPFGYFRDAIGEFNADRLPDEHQLDIRWVSHWSWRGLGLTAELGFDNVYNNPRVRGFDLNQLSGLEPSLPIELGWGRELRWGFGLSR